MLKTFMIKCAADALDKMGLLEHIGSKLIVKGESHLKLTGKVLTRYLDPITLQPKGDWQVNHNLVVDTGAVEIVKWLTNSGSPGSAGFLKYMALGSTATAAAHGQTALLGEYTGTGTYVRILATLAAAAEGGNGNKVYQATAVFPACTGCSAAAEFGMFSQLAVGGTMFNRSVLSPTRDNENNALEIIYQCTVAPV